MSRLATATTSCLLGFLCLGASDQVRPPPSQTVIVIEICKRPPVGQPTCGPSKEYLPRVGHVSARRPKINCPEDCDAIVSAGLRLRMTAKPTRDPTGEYRFAGWSGLCAGEPEVCQRTIPARRRVQMKAYFSLQAREN